MSRTPKLKVYQGSLGGRGSYCVATSSMARVATIVKLNGFNASIGFLRAYWSETGNHEQIAAASARPGVLMFSADRHGDDYRPYDEIRQRSSFGFDHMTEMREIEALLEAKGMKQPDLHFEAIRIYEDRHRDDLTYRQRQMRARAERAANPAPRRHLSRDEIAYLITRLDGVNDPTGQGAKAVLIAMLPALG